MRKSALSKYCTLMSWFHSISNSICKNVLQIALNVSKGIQQIQAKLRQNIHQWKLRYLALAPELSSWPRTAGVWLQPHSQEWGYTGRGPGIDCSVSPWQGVGDGEAKGPIQPPRPPAPLPCSPRAPHPPGSQWADCHKASPPYLLKASGGHWLLERKEAQWTWEQASLPSPLRPRAAPAGRLAGSGKCSQRAGQGSLCHPGSRFQGSPLDSALPWAPWGEAGTHTDEHHSWDEDSRLSWFSGVRHPWPWLRPATLGGQASWFSLDFISSYVNEGTVHYVDSGMGDQLCETLSRCFINVLI